MAKAIKTTVYLDAADYERLKAIARSEGRAPAECVREAVAEYGRKKTARPRPKSVGSWRSGRSDLSERTEELLEGLGEHE